MENVLLNNGLYGLNQVSAADLQAAQKSCEAAKIEETAENFEAFFITRMMESMFEGVSTDGMFGGGNAEKIYRSMLLDEYGRTMAKTGGIGVKETVMNAILQMQEMESQGYIEG